MMTLGAFLLARIAEDEEVGCICRLGWVDRVEVEVEAKRQIVGQWQVAQPPVSAADYAVDDELTFTLCWLASIYADHPDYREEWRV